MRFKKTISIFTAAALTVSASSLLITESVNAAVIGGYDNVVSVDELPSWVPTSYEGASTIANGQEIAMQYAQGYVMFCCHTDVNSGDYYTFVQNVVASMDEDQQSGTTSYTTNKYTYVNDSKTDQYDVLVYDFDSVSKENNYLFYFTQFNSSNEAKSRYKTILTIDTELNITPVTSLEKVTVLNYDTYKSIAESGGGTLGVSVVDGKIVIAVHDVDGYTNKIYVNDSEVAALKSSSSDKTDSYTVKSFYPTESGNIDIKIEITNNSTGAKNTYTVYLYVDEDLNVTTRTVDPTETTEPTTETKIWYPQSESEAKEFLTNYPSGATYSGDTVCFVTTDGSYSYEKSSSFEYTENTYGDYKVLVVKAVNEGTASVSLNTSDSDGLGKLETVYPVTSTKSDNGYTVAVATATKNQITAFALIEDNLDNFEFIDEFYKKYGEIVYSGNKAVVIKKIDSTENASDYELSDSSKASKKTAVVSSDDASTIYNVCVLTATSEGSVRATLKISDSTTVKADFSIDSDLNFTYIPGQDETETSATTSETILSGDVNNDGSLSISDAVLLNKYIVGSAKFSDLQKLAANTYVDSEINATDTVCLLKFLVLAITELPVYPE